MKARNAAAMPIDPDTAFDAASTADIATVALRLLAESRPSPLVHEIRRRQPITMREVAALLARARATFSLRANVACGQRRRDCSCRSIRHFGHLMNDAWDTFSSYGLLRDAGAEASEVVTPVENFLRAEIIPALTSRQTRG